MVDNMAYARKSLADSQNQRVPLYVGSGGDEITEVSGRIVGGNIVNGIQGVKATTTTVDSLTTEQVLTGNPPSTDDFIGVVELWINGIQQMEDDGGGGLQAVRALIVLDSRSQTYQAVVQNNWLLLNNAQVKIGEYTDGPDTIVQNAYPMRTYG